MIADIPLSRIVESPTNPRRTYDSESLEELAESIRSKGVLSPVLVRPVDDDRYELVFGHRRLRAARLALLPSLPAMVRELDDRAVLEVQVIENAQRSDVHPLEEADAYRELHERHGLAVDHLAARLGKSRAYVYSRLRLCSLPPFGREAFLAGKFSASVALLVARMPTETQQVLALEQLLQYDDPTLNDARRITRGLMLRLADAPFDLAATSLVPRAGACTNCPKRSTAQRALFEDVEDDRCLDSACFYEKSDAAWKLRAAAARAEGWRVLNDDETAEAFPYPSAPNYLSSRFVDLDSPVSHGQPQTWREQLGNPAPILARDPEGRGRELGIRPAAVHSSENALRYAKERAAAEKERALREEIRRVAAPQLVTALAGQLAVADVRLLRILAAHEIVNAPTEGLKALAEAMGVATGDTGELEADVAESLHAAPSTALAEFCAASMVYHSLWFIGWNMETPRYTPVLEQACADFGVDLKQAEASAARAGDAEGGR